MVKNKETLLSVLSTISLIVPTYQEAVRGTISIALRATQHFREETRIDEMWKLVEEFALSLFGDREMATDHEVQWRLEVLKTVYGWDDDTVDDFYSKLTPHIRPVQEERDPPSLLGTPRTWAPWDQIKAVVDASIAKEWKWYANTQCKYVELRIDMRDGAALIRNRNGDLISLEQLQYQYTSPKSPT